MASVLLLLVEEPSHPRLPPNYDLFPRTSNPPAAAISSRLHRHRCSHLTLNSRSSHHLLQLPLLQQLKNDALEKRAVATSAIPQDKHSFLPPQYPRKTPQKLEYVSLCEKHVDSKGEAECEMPAKLFPLVNSQHHNSSDRFSSNDLNTTFCSHDSNGKTRRPFRNHSTFSENVHKHKPSNCLLPSLSGKAFTISRARWDQVSHAPLHRRDPPKKIGLENQLSAPLQESDRGSVHHEAELGYYEARAGKSAMAQILEKLQNIKETESKSTRISFPWGKALGFQKEQRPEEKTKGIRNSGPAELFLPESELKRLRILSLRVTQLLRIGKEGVTAAVVKSIHEQWCICAVVKIKCEGSASLNMKKTQDDLEHSTGGLIVWRSGGTLALYRGKNYLPPCNKVKAGCMNITIEEEASKHELIKCVNQKPFTPMEDVKDDCKSSDFPAEYDTELDSFMDCLGPRVVGWIGKNPVPIDADLLLATDPSFKAPFRLLPYGRRAKIGNTALTTLRRFFRPLPPHFVLGMDNGLEGVSGAILKFWERSEVVKIGMKRGISNMKVERIAEELKRLTGGVLLARDKSCITLHRGHDFLPPTVAETLSEWEALASEFQRNEEKAGTSRRKTSSLHDEVPFCTAGTLRESIELGSKFKINEVQHNSRGKALKAARSHALQRLQRKMNTAITKKRRTELELEKVESCLAPAHALADHEIVTDEEAFMFDKIGLRMKAFLLLGRRGIFDGIVLNMHLHWKHRELVKVILKERNKAAAELTARMLENESGGILISVTTVSKGHAAIFFRGKNYQRPSQLRPPNLLTKRKALKRVIELQRHKSLEDGIGRLERSMQKMKETYV